MVKVEISGYSMWPTLKPGQVIECESFDTVTNEIGSLVDQIIVFNHPWKKEVVVVKRVESIQDRKLFVVGDNPDPTESQDSHNYGPISPELLIGVIKL